MKHHWSVSSSTVTYLLELVSQCLPHVAAVLWALLCVCGASEVRLHPHDRLRKKDISNFYLSLRLQVYLDPTRCNLEELTAIVLDVVDSNVGGDKRRAMVFFLVPLLCQQLGLCLLRGDNILYLCTRKVITEAGIIKNDCICRSQVKF